MGIRYGDPHLRMASLYLTQPTPTLWRSFLDGTRVPSEDPVVARWARVRALGVSPEGPSEPPVLTAREVRVRRERLEPLLHAGQAILNEAAAEFSRNHYSLLVADPDGVIVERFGGGDFEPIAKQNRLVEGAAWSEATRGTNAIGTAAAEGHLVAVEGCAHWERQNHQLSCYASPIFGPDGDLVAVIDATSRSEAAAMFAPLAIRALATHLESVLVHRSYDAMGGLGAVVRSLERFVQPAFLIERGGRVRAANGGGRPWLEQRGLHDFRRVPSPSAELRGLRSLWQAALDGRSHVLLGDDALTVEAIQGPDHRVCAALVFVESAPQPRMPSTPSEPFARLTGSDAGLAEQKARAARFARTALPVLLLSETGTGKELMARAIHGASPRRDGPFVALNCGAISEALLESELFGYAPGAFTGARPEGAEGKIEAAHQGTLFLDEVAEMPARVQASLLRVLEDGSFNRIGEVRSRSADVRLVAATCRDLPDLVASGRFRQDLYFRIRGATLSLPPLRERSDRVELARTLVADLAPGAPPPLAPDAVEHIQSHGWPGNVRELKTALAHALALDPEVIRAEHLPSSPVQRATPAPVGGRTVRESEADALEQALARADGNMSEAARQLGVARSTLYRMMRRHGRLPPKDAKAR